MTYSSVGRACDPRAADPLPRCLRVVNARSRIPIARIAVAMLLAGVTVAAAQQCLPFLITEHMSLDRALTEMRSNPNPETRRAAARRAIRLAEDIDRSVLDAAKSDLELRELSRYILIHRLRSAASMLDEVDGTGSARAALGH